MWLNETIDLAFEREGQMPLLTGNTHVQWSDAAVNDVKFLTQTGYSNHPAIRIVVPAYLSWHNKQAGEDNVGISDHISTANTDAGFACYLKCLNPV